MNGLFDILNTDQGRFGLGLLAAAGPRADGAGFGARLQEAMGTMDAYKKQQLMAQIEKMRMDNAQAEMADKQAQRTQAKQMQDLYKRFATPAQQVVPAIQGDSETGIFPSAGQPAKPAGYDYKGLAGALAAVNPMAALELEQKLVKQGPEFSPEVRYDQAGRGFVVAKDGSVKYLDGIKARDKLEEIRLGDKVAFRSPYSTEIQGSMPVGQSPDSKASNALGWANFGLSRQREAREASAANQPSMVWNSDLGTFVNPKTLQTGMPIGPDGKPMTPGGKMTEDQAKASGWLIQAENAWKNMQGAMASTPGAARPGVGDLVGSVAGMTGAANLLTGKDRQKFNQASSSLSEALLRAATGAGVNKDEAAQKIKEITPQFGESEESVKQKMESIPLYLESLKMRAGPGAKKAEWIIDMSPNGKTSAMSSGGWSVTRN